MIPIPDAFRLIAETVQPLGHETIPLSESVGRVLATDIKSDVDSPPHDKSMMDGYALNSADFASGTRRFEVIETIAAGGWPEQEVTPGTASRIMTGAPIPRGADAVVMIEQTQLEEVAGKSIVSVEIDDLPAGKYTLAKADNFRKGQVVFCAGHTFRPTNVGLLAEAGAATIPVGVLPKIAVLPTGDEIVDCSIDPGRGMIRNSNGPMLVAMSAGLGLDVVDLGIGRDNEKKLRPLVDEGLNHDILLLTGGVSMGQFDLVPGILQRAGVEQVFHKVAIKPGKPIWFGVLRRKDAAPTYVFGLPGNPVSGLVGFHLFVRTAVRILSGAKHVLPQSVMAELNSTHHARGNRATYWPGSWVGDDGPQRKIEPLDWHGSSDLIALGTADALVYFPAGTKEHPAGELVQVFSL